MMSILFLSQCFTKVLWKYFKSCTEARGSIDFNFLANVFRYARSSGAHLLNASAILFLDV